MFAVRIISSAICLFRCHNQPFTESRYIVFVFGHITTVTCTRWVQLQRKIPESICTANHSPIDAHQALMSVSQSKSITVEPPVVILIQLTHCNVTSYLSFSATDADTNSPLDVVVLSWTRISRVSCCTIELNCGMYMISMTCRQN